MATQKYLHVAEVIVFPKRRAGRPKKLLNVKKLDRMKVPAFARAESAVESLLIFDARALDADVRRELLRILPEMIRVRRAWRAEFMECGCISCHKKRVNYGAGGFCNRCWGRIYQRMTYRYKKLMEDRDLPAELAKFTGALTLKFSAAQKLLGGNDD